mmetsp:Transcript_9292/g.20246  ORF Transcript_9292/g.20246 Transcript_9292/m.20246 type:complete len:207 (-) Transcript_9292:170-790(-)
MLHGSSRGYTLAGVVFEGAIDEFDTGSVPLQSRYKLGPRLGVISGVVRLPLRKLHHGGPRFRRRRAQCLEDLQQLVLVASPREERTAVQHLRKDAPHRPDVHRSRILPGSHQNVGRTIPQSDHLMRVGPHGNPESTGQPKIGKLQSTLAVDQKVLWLQITVQHSVLMTVGHPSNQLEQKRLRGRGVQSSSAYVQQLLQILVQELKH